MNENGSSQKKPGKKANTPNHLTSFSTIDLKTQEVTLKPLNKDEQKIILETMYRGGSPAWVCKDLDLNYSRYLETLNSDEVFRQRISDAKTALSENIAFLLFRTAMEGNVTAQTNYLKLFPPAKWNSNSSVRESDPESEEWIEKLTDKELFHLAKEMDIHVPEEFMEGSPDS